MARSEVCDRVVTGLTNFRAVNVARCEASFHRLDEWSETDWAAAACGELGEAANLIKKRRRGEAVPASRVAGELADAVTDIDLLAARMGVDLGRALVIKFDEVSDRVGSSLRFGSPGPADPAAEADETVAPANADGPPVEIDELIERAETAAAALTALTEEHVELLMQGGVSTRAATTDPQVLLAQAAARDLRRAVDDYQTAADAWRRQEAPDGHQDVEPA